MINPSTRLCDFPLRDWFEAIVEHGIRQHLSEPGLCFAPLEFGVHGRYLNRRETRGRAKILIALTRCRDGEEAVWDTLVHEVAHHAVAEICRPDDGDHGTIFCNVANDMAPRLGYEGRIMRETRRARYWPGSLRGPTRIKREVG